MMLGFLVIYKQGTSLVRMAVSVVTTYKTKIQAYIQKLIHDIV